MIEVVTGVFYALGAGAQALCVLRHSEKFYRDTIGLIDTEWVGWSFLSQEASVAVLTVDGEDRFWQRLRGGIAFFAFTATADLELELRVLTADGVEIGKGDRTRPAEPTQPTVEPILGYGDFSDIPYGDIDRFEVTLLIVDCMNDQGFAVYLIPPGDGISFANVPEDQNRAAQFAEAGCRAGLRLPEPPKLRGTVSDGALSSPTQITLIWRPNDHFPKGRRAARRGSGV